MHELLATPGLVWVVVATFSAGMVYGFSGFGAGLIFMPVATAVLSPSMAIGAFAVSALASFFTLVPKAWKEADRANTLWMIAAAVLCTPIGIWILRSADTTILRWALCAIIAATLLLLMSGWRYHLQPSKSLRVGIGGAAGIMMGSVGLPGPLVILFQLGGQDSISRSRANTLVFLTFSSISLVPLMALQGILHWSAVVLGLFLILPYGLGTMVGRRIFDPNKELVYRRVAYGVAATAVVAGLPLWD